VGRCRGTRFLREVEVTFPDRAVPFNQAFSRQNPNYTFEFRAVRVWRASDIGKPISPARP
jgi:hypothetical protein